MAYSVGTAFLQIAPSMRGLHLKIEREVKTWRAIEIPATLNIDSKAAEAKVAAATKSRDVAINAKADTAAAAAKIDEAARNRRTTINVNADTSRARRAIAGLGSGGGGGSLLLKLGIAAAPLAGPLLAAGGAAGAGLAGIGAGTGAGALGFGLLATAEVKRAQKAQGVLAKAQQKVATARTNLSNATTPGQRKGDTNTLDQALLAQKNAAAAIGPQQQRGLAAISSLKKAWNGLLTTVSKPIFRALTPGIKALEKSMPALAKFIRPVARGLGDMFGTIGKAAGSKDFQSFASTFGKFAGGLFKDAGPIIVNLARAFGGLLTAFMPLSKDMGKGLVDLTKKFADWATGLSKSKGFHDFIATARKDGPVIVKTIRDMAVTFGKLIIALAPFGGVLLKGISKVFGFLAKLSPGQLLAIAAGVSTLFAAFKIARLIHDIRLASGAFQVLNVVMDANPIGLVILALAGLAAGFIYAYTHSKTFRNIVNTALHAVATAGQWMWNNVLKPVFGFLVDAFKRGIQWAQNLWHGVQNAWQGIQSAFRAGVRYVVNIFLDMVGKVLNAAAKLFGWVPGIGGKLKAAAAAFQSFRDRVNAALSGIHNRDVYVHVHASTAAIAKNPSLNKPRVQPGGGFAHGGYTGPGAKYEPAGIVHRGEFVHDKETTLRARPILEAIHRSKGRMFGYAGGGLVDVRSNTADAGAWFKRFSSGANTSIGSYGYPDQAAVLRNQIVAAARAAIMASVSAIIGGRGSSIGGGLFKPIHAAITHGLHDAYTGFPAVDAAAPVGSRVYAGASGQVVKSYDIRGYEPRRPGAQDGYRSYGRVIQIRHNGFSTLYAHLSRRGVSVGQHVAGGQIIGLSGDTGNSTGPHLHFGAAGRSPYSFFDRGGYLPPGLSTVYNGTGKPEPVLTTRQFSDIRSLADGGGKAGWTANYGDVYTYDVDEFRRKQRADMRKLELLASIPT